MRALALHNRFDRPWVVCPRCHVRADVSPHRDYAGYHVARCQDHPEHDLIGTIHTEPRRGRVFRLNPGNHPDLVR